jgi:FAD:protein FMN transferase
MTLVPAAGWQGIEIDDARGRIRVAAGVEIDLGATAKALAADRAAAAAFRATGSPVLVDLGGDIAVAGPAPAGGWPILVTDDHRAPSDADGQVVAIAAGGLATSSTTVRRWRTSEGLAHHVVDPRTGRPAAEIWRTVSVAAASCVAANTASTAAIVLGDDAPRWLEHNGYSARLVRRDGRVVVTGGWPAGQELRCAA